MAGQKIDGTPLLGTCTFDWAAGFPSVQVRLINFRWHCSSWLTSIWLIKMFAVEWKADMHSWPAEGYHENFPCPARESHLLKEWIQPSALFTIMVTLNSCQMICTQLTPIMLKYATRPLVMALVWLVITAHSSYLREISIDPTNWCQLGVFSFPIFTRGLGIQDVS